MLAVLTATLVVLGGTAGCAPPLTETISGGPEWGWTPQAAPLDLGVTHMQYSLAASDPAAARSRGADILRASGRRQVQHLMGFGVLNPEPAPGVYDWSTLDARMALIAGTGGSAVLTLAGAPDWMKGGQPGESDYTRIEVAPLREHYDDFAALCAAAVARYPQVAAVQVWNELKGFYDPQVDRWDAAGYTDLYNRVLRAVKDVRPRIAVGGPYMPLDAWSSPSAFATPSTVRGPWGVTDQRSLDVVSYWLANNAGADFLSVDAGTGTRDRGPVTGPSQGAERFATLTRWLRERSPLPVWWSEFYPATTEATGDADESASAARAAVTLESVAAMARSGAAVALLWQPQASEGFPFAALWTDTADPDGGRPTALTAPWTWLVPRLAGGGIEIGRSPDGRLLAFRDRVAPRGARAPEPGGMLLVNTSPGTIRISVPGGAPVDLDGFGTAILPRG